MTSGAQIDVEQPRAEFEAAQANQAVVIERALQSAMASLQVQAGRERDEAVRAALTQVTLMGREQLGAETAAASADLSAKKDLIESRLNQVQNEVRTDLDRLSKLVGQLGESTSQRFGQVDQSLRVHAEITQHLTSTTQSLREALASPNNRVSGVSGWPRTSSAPPASSRTSSTASARPWPAPARASPTSRS